MEREEKPMTIGQYLKLKNGKEDNKDKKTINKDDRIIVVKNPKVKEK